MPKGVHDGHRDRVKKEFLARGFDDNTPPHKIIEMLLFYSIPRKDTNEIAHNLLSKFGSIKGILDAPESELLKVDGITQNSVVLIKMILPIARMYYDKKDKSKPFLSIDELGEFLQKKYYGYKNEMLAITSLDARGKMIGFDIINEGDTTAVELSMRKIVEVILKNSPACVVLSHNHPGASALPSGEDIELTRKIVELLKNLNVIMLDHIIIGFDDYVSLAQSEKYSQIFK